MSFPSARELAARQLEIDRQRTQRFPELLPHKLERMSESPLAFLRGAAPLFYEVLKSDPELAAGPDGSGVLVGDAHLENFGAYAADRRVSAPHSNEATKCVCFDLNDFDDTFHGPWRWDVLRLTTSLILGGRELGVSGRDTLELAERLIANYVATAFERRALPEIPHPVAVLIRQVGERSRKELLDARTAIENGQRRFMRGLRYAQLSLEFARLLPDALARYSSALPVEERPSAQQLRVIDSAFRVAGTGSLGALRIAVLIEGKGGVDGAWILDLKETLPASAAPLLGVLPPPSATAIAAACRACLAEPPRQLGTAELGACSMLVRRLSPQEDKLSLGRMKKSDIAPLAAYLGALLGRAHARAADAKPAAWSASDQGALLDRAIKVAGLHEAIYLELCRARRSGLGSDAIANPERNSGPRY